MGPLHHALSPCHSGKQGGCMAVLRRCPWRASLVLLLPCAASACLHLVELSPGHDDKSLFIPRLRHVARAGRPGGKAGACTVATTRNWKHQVAKICSVRSFTSNTILPRNMYRLHKPRSAP